MRTLGSLAGTRPGPQSALGLYAKKKTWSDCSEVFFECLSLRLRLRLSLSLFLSIFISNSTVEEGGVCFAKFLLCFAMCYYVFAMFSYAFAMFYYVLLCFSMFL